MTRFPALVRAGLGLSVSCVACDGFELPVPPDMSGLVAAYEQPTGVITVDNAPALADRVLDAATLAQEQSPFELANELVDELQHLGGVEPSTYDNADAGSDTDSEPTLLGNRIDVGASAKLRHTCSGWQDAAAGDPSAGSVELTVAADARGLVSTVWGALNACRMTRGRAALELTGTLNVHFGAAADRVRISQLKAVGYLVAFDGRVRVNQTVDRAVRFDFRVFAPGEIQLSIPLSDGTNVVVVFDASALRPDVDNERVSAELRTRAGAWRCDFAFGERAGICRDAQDGARELSW
ncbi:MAG: hypothetical protein RL701_1417 [Pseudomonadota bacterium]